MIRTPAIALTGILLTMILASQANALTLTNLDGMGHRLEINEGGDETVTHEIVVGPEETLDDLCQEGCTIGLDGGEQQSFEGYEKVFIEDGRFVIGE